MPSRAVTNSFFTNLFRRQYVIAVFCCSLVLETALFLCQAALETAVFDCRGGVRNSCSLFPRGVRNSCFLMPCGVRNSCFLMPHGIRNSCFLLLRGVINSCFIQSRCVRNSCELNPRGVRNSSCSFLSPIVPLSLHACETMYPLNPFPLSLYLLQYISEMYPKKPIDKQKAISHTTQLYT